MAPVKHLPVPEELAVEQGLGQPGAVDRDERRVAQDTALVHRAGDELLAGATLAAQQDGALVLADGVDQAIDGLHALAVADELAEPVQAPDLAAESCVLVLQRAETEDAVQARVTSRGRAS
jgi:hypothetical protein